MNQWINDTSRKHIFHCKWCLVRGTRAINLRKVMAAVFFLFFFFLRSFFLFTRQPTANYIFPITLRSLWTPLFSPPTLFLSKRETHVILFRAHNKRAAALLLAFHVNHNRANRAGALSLRQKSRWFHRCNCNFADITTKHEVPRDPEPLYRIYTEYRELSLYPEYPLSLRYLLFHGINCMILDLILQMWFRRGDESIYAFDSTRLFSQRVIVLKFFPPIFPLFVPMNIRFSLHFILIEKRTIIRNSNDNITDKCRNYHL